MDERIMEMPETRDIVQQGVDLFAKAEVGLNDATEALLELREIFAEAYLNGAVKGDEAILLKGKAVQHAAMIAAVKEDILSFHQECTKLAQSAGEDIETPYAELPPRNTRSGGR